VPGTWCQVPPKKRPPLPREPLPMVVNDVDSLGFSFDLVDLDDENVCRRIFGKSEGKDTKERTIVCR
jgi:hypothetical protein